MSSTEESEFDSDAEEVLSADVGSEAEASNPPAAKLQQQQPRRGRRRHRTQSVADAAPPTKRAHRRQLETRAERQRRPRAPAAATRARKQQQHSKRKTAAKKRHSVQTQATDKNSAVGTNQRTNGQQPEPQQRSKQEPNGDPKPTATAQQQRRVGPLGWYPDPITVQQSDGSLLRMTPVVVDSSERAATILIGHTLIPADERALVSSL